MSTASTKNQSTNQKQQHSSTDLLGISTALANISLQESPRNKEDKSKGSLVPNNQPTRLEVKVRLASLKLSKDEMKQHAKGEYFDCPF